MLEIAKGLFIDDINVRGDRPGVHSQHLDHNPLRQNSARIESSQTSLAAEKT
jgi:hypothetical protein